MEVREDVVLDQVDLVVLALQEPFLEPLSGALGGGHDQLDDRHPFGRQVGVEVAHPEDAQHEVAARGGLIGHERFAHHAVHPAVYDVHACHLPALLADVMDDVVVVVLARQRDDVLAILAEGVNDEAVVLRHGRNGDVRVVSPPDALEGGEELAGGVVGDAHFGSLQLCSHSFPSKIASSQPQNLWAECRNLSIISLLMYCRCRLRREHVPFSMAKTINYSKFWRLSQIL